MAVSGRVTALAERFMLARSVDAALPKLRAAWDQGLGFSVDLLGEACVSDAEAEEYQGRYVALIETLGRAVRAWPANAVLERDHLGPVPRAGVSVKISALSARIRPADTEGSVARLLDMLRPVLDAAAREHVLLNFDMEQRALKDLTIALFRRCCEAVDFPAALALQAYLRSGDDDAAELIA